MSYCLNPACEHPQNPDEASCCLNCQSTLLLQERYRSLKLIAQGGFGRTFLAVDEFHPFQQRCVIKQFFPYNWTGCDRKLATELFRQEALRLEVLGQHPQIPKLLAYHEQDGQQYLVQEFIDGQNLAQELAEQGAFNEDQIRHLLQNVLPILQFVHNHQIIHRDIKPANIIRRYKDGQFVLVDFGAAKYVTGITSAQTGTVIGSAEYTAPEQTKGKAVFTSDLYSLGVTCIHLLTQVSPFDLFDSSEDAWVWRDYLNHPISESLSYILDKLLQNSLKRRYQSAQEVLQDLNLKSKPVVINSLLMHQADSRKGLERQEASKQIESSSITAPGLSATVFVPQTQSWCRIPNLADPSQSQLVWSLITLNPSNNLQGQPKGIKSSIFPILEKRKKLAAKPRKPSRWLWLGLGAAVVLFLTGFKWQSHLSFPVQNAFSGGVVGVFIPEWVEKPVVTSFWKVTRPFRRQCFIFKHGYPPS